MFEKDEVSEFLLRVLKATGSVSIGRKYEFLCVLSAIDFPVNCVKRDGNMYIITKI